MLLQLDSVIYMHYFNLNMPQNQNIKTHKLVYCADFRQRILSLLLVIAISGLFVFLRLSADNKMDIGKWLGPCGFERKYGLPCPTCGITTSALVFVKGRILESFYIQPAGAFLCCILVVSLFLSFLTAFFGIYFSFVKRLFTEVKLRVIVFVFILILAGGWAVTLARALVSDL
jgi:hypothetical protein